MELSIVGMPLMKLIVLLVGKAKVNMPIEALIYVLLSDTLIELFSYGIKFIVCIKKLFL